MCIAQAMEVLNFKHQAIILGKVSLSALAKRPASLDILVKAEFKKYKKKIWLSKALCIIYQFSPIF